MISFRYHLVSIVGVLVALAAGILIGGTVLNSGFQQRLKIQVEDLSRSVDNFRKETLVLQTELKTSNQFALQAERWLTAGRLTGQPVVLVVNNGVDAQEVAGVRQALGLAGASLQGVVVLNPRLSDPSAMAALAQTVGAPASATAGQLSSDAARSLARRLLTGTPASGTDALAALAGGGFVSVSDEAKGGVKAVGGAGQSVVVLGGAPNPPVGTQDFMMPFLQTLAGGHRPAAAAEASTATGAQSFLSPIRSDGSLDGNIVTVDNVDQATGQSALVLGLADLLQTGSGGDYGVKCGSCTLLPHP